MSEIKLHVSGLLFDMDGVLISSIGSVERSWKKWAAHYGLPDAENFQIPHGTRAADIIARVKPDLDVAVGLKFIEDIEIEDVSDLRVLDGVRELLKSLPNERWAIVTSATYRLLIARLEAAGLPQPDRIISGDRVVNGKPHPEPYIRGAELIHAEPARCIVVEDAPSGVGAGKAAGCRVLGVLGTHSAEELRDAGADWIVASLEKVKAAPTTDGLEISFETI